MSSEAELITIAQSVLGTDQEILAAGLFSHHTAGVKKVGAFAVGNTVGDIAGKGVGGSLVGLAAGLIAEKAEEGHEAKKEGLERIMLLAVTADTIHVLDWKDKASTKELVSLPRATTEVQVTKTLAERHLHLVDTDKSQELRLEGTTSAISGMAPGDKVVLALLSS